MSEKFQTYNIQSKTNQQILSLGMLEEDLYNSSKIHEYIEHLETDFDFIMIEELFYESLVLFADYLCIPLEYMVGFNSAAFQVQELYIIYRPNTNNYSFLNSALTRSLFLPIFLRSQSHIAALTNQHWKSLSEKNQCQT